MKKLIFTIFIFFTLTSCQNNTELDSEPLLQNIEVYQDETIVENNIVNHSNKISDFEKEDLNIQDELFQGICSNNYKYWRNEHYGYEICIPNNWNAISSYSEKNEKFHDYIEEIGIFYDNQLKDSILLSSNDRSNIFDFGSYGITDTEVREIINDKIYINGYKRNENNKLEYQGSFLILKSGNKISNFYYDIHNKEHVFIIGSIKKIN